MSIFLYIIYFIIPDILEGNIEIKDCSCQECKMERGILGAYNYSPKVVYEPECYDGCMNAEFLLEGSNLTRPTMLYEYCTLICINEDLYRDEIFRGLYLQDEGLSKALNYLEGGE